MKNINKFNLFNLYLVGSQMRRDNEKKHQENIDLILKINEEHLVKSDAIFLQAPGLNMNILVGENKSLGDFRKKIINIPYNCQRANYTNMMEIFNKLVNVRLEINDDIVKKMI